MNSDKTTSIESIMTALPLETAIPSRTIFDIANQMKEKNKVAIIIVENMVGSSSSSSSSSNTNSSSFESASADSNSSNRSSMLAKPLGIITERDIVRRIVSEEKDPLL